MLKPISAFISANSRNCYSVEYFRKLMSGRREAGMKRQVPLLIAIITFAGLSLSALHGQSPKPAGASARQAGASPEAEQTPPASHEWRDYAGSPEGTRYMPLTQITKNNVSQLEVAWNYPYAETQFNPVAAHGIVYTKARNK